MKCFIFISVCATMLCLPVHAETMLNLKMGPAWPKELRKGNVQQGITAWEPSIEVGALFDRIVGIGFDAEFQWKKRQVDSTYHDTLSNGNVVDITVSNKIERFYLFPPSLYISIDPVPDLIVHPVIKGQIGLSLLYYKNVWFDDVDGDGKEERDWSEDSGKRGHIYYGIFGKVGLDALYDLGENVSAFVGFEFQFGNAKHKKKGTENQYYKKQIYGPGIRMGFRFIM